MRLWARLVDSVIYFLIPYIFSCVSYSIYISYWGGANRPEVERCVREREVEAEVQYLIDKAFPDWKHKYSRVCNLVDVEVALDYASWYENIVGWVAEIMPSEMLPDVPLNLRSCASGR